MLAELKQADNPLTVRHGSGSSDLFIAQNNVEKGQAVQALYRAGGGERKVCASADGAGGGERKVCASADGAGGEPSITLRKFTAARVGRLHYYSAKSLSCSLPPNSRRAVVLRRLINVIFELIQKNQKKPKIKEKFLVDQASGLFDKTWYLANNPDVNQAKVDPLLHYLHAGGFEGHDPDQILAAPGTSMLMKTSKKPGSTRLFIT